LDIKIQLKFIKYVSKGFWKNKTKEKFCFTVFVAISA